MAFICLLALSITIGDIVITVCNGKRLLAGLLRAVSQGPFLPITVMVFPSGSILAPVWGVKAATEAFLFPILALFIPIHSIFVRATTISRGYVKGRVQRGIALEKQGRNGFGRTVGGEAGCLAFGGVLSSRLYSLVRGFIGSLVGALVIFTTDGTTFHFYASIAIIGLTV